MKILFLFFVLYFNISLATNNKDAIKNSFVFTIGEEVYSLKDLSEFHLHLKSFACLMEDTLLLQSNPMSLDKLGKYFQVPSDLTQEFSAQQKIIFLKLKKMLKIIAYVETQSVKRVADVDKSLFELSQSQKCGQGSFSEKGELHPTFAKLVQTEIFLRSRYRADQSIKSKYDDKLDKSIQLFYISIDKQISEHVFWP